MAGARQIFAQALAAAGDDAVVVDVARVGDGFNEAQAGPLLTGGIGAAVHGGENVAQIFVGNGRGVHGAGNAGMGIEDSLAHGQTTPLIGQLRTVAESRRCL